MIRAAIFGASGYAGGELLRLLLDHPKAEPTAVISRSQAGQPVAAVHTHLARLTDLDVHERACAGRRRNRCRVPRRSPRVCRRSRARASRYRNAGHRSLGRLPAQGRRLLREVLRSGNSPASRGSRNSSYGLPELFREQIAASRAVASPGCFATAAILGIAPLWRERSRRAGRPGVGLRDHRLLGRRRFSVADHAPSSPGVGLLRLRDRRPPPPARDRGVPVGDRSRRLRAGSSSRRIRRRSSEASS